MKHSFYHNGILYQWECTYSNSFYGRERHYKIYTEEQSYPTVIEAITEEFDLDDIPLKSEYDKLWETGKGSLEASIRGYYTLDYNKSEDYFFLVRKQGYDD